MFPSFTHRYRVVDILALVSLILLSLLLLAYIVLPKRSQPNMQKVSLTIALIFFTSTKAFTMFQNYSTTLCSNVIQAANVHNRRCSAQAFLMIFGAQALVLWASMRAYTVLALVVYQRSTQSFRWSVIMNIISWGVPLIFASIAIGSHKIGYTFSGICVLEPDLQPALYFIPLLVLPFT